MNAHLEKEQAGDADSSFSAMAGPFLPDLELSWEAVAAETAVAIDHVEVILSSGVLYLLGCVAIFEELPPTIEIYMKSSRRSPSNTFSLTFKWAHAHQVDFIDPVSGRPLISSELGTTSPFSVESHLVVFDALMRFTMSSVVHRSPVVHHLRTVLLVAEDDASGFPFDVEEALLMWIETCVSRFVATDLAFRPDLDLVSVFGHGAVLCCVLALYFPHVSVFRDASLADVRADAAMFVEELNSYRSVGAAAGAVSAFRYLAVAFRVLVDLGLSPWLQPEDIIYHPPALRTSILLFCFEVFKLVEHHTPTAPPVSRRSPQPAAVSSSSSRTPPRTATPLLAGSLAARQSDTKGRRERIDRLSAQLLAWNAERHERSAAVSRSAPVFPLASDQEEGSGAPSANVRGSVAASPGRGTPQRRPQWLSRRPESARGSPRAPALADRARRGSPVSSPSRSADNTPAESQRPHSRVRGEEREDDEQHSGDSDPDPLMQSLVVVSAPRDDEMMFTEEEQIEECEDFAEQVGFKTHGTSGAVPGSRICLPGTVGEDSALSEKGTAADNSSAFELTQGNQTKEEEEPWFLAATSSHETQVVQAEASGGDDLSDVSAPSDDAEGALPQDASVDVSAMSAVPAPPSAAPTVAPGSPLPTNNKSPTTSSSSPAPSLHSPRQQQHQQKTPVGGLSATVVRATPVDDTHGEDSGNSSEMNSCDADGLATTTTVTTATALGNGSSVSPQQTHSSSNRHPERETLDEMILQMHMETARAAVNDTAKHVEIGLPPAAAAPPCAPAPVAPPAVLTAESLLRENTLLKMKLKHQLDMLQQSRMALRSARERELRDAKHLAMLQVLQGSVRPNAATARAASPITDVSVAVPINRNAVQALAEKSDTRPAAEWDVARLPENGDIVGSPRRRRGWGAAAVDAGGVVPPSLASSAVHGQPDSEPLLARSPWPLSATIRRQSGAEFASHDDLAHGAEAASVGVVGAGAEYEEQGPTPRRPLAMMIPASEVDTASSVLVTTPGVIAGLEHADVRYQQFIAMQQQRSEERRRSMLLRKRLQQQEDRQQQQRQRPLVDSPLPAIAADDKYRMGDGTFATSGHAIAAPFRPRSAVVSSAQKSDDRVAGPRADIARGLDRQSAATDERALDAGNRRFIPGNKSNRKVVRNAIQSVCLAGPVNRKEMLEVVTSMDACPCEYYVVLVKDVENPLYRGLYAIDPDMGLVRRIHGRGPRALEETAIGQFMKYDTGSKRFRLIQLSEFNANTDAIALSAAFLRANARR